MMQVENLLLPKGAEMAEVQPQTVREYQEMLASIYTKANERYSGNDLFLRLLEEISKIMEMVRKDVVLLASGREKFASQLARTYSLWNALATRLDIDLQEALWNKFPAVCSYCLRDAESKCICAVEHLRIPDDERELVLRRLRKERSREPKTLRDHQELHRKLYGLQNSRIPLQSTADHLAEEMGEVSREFRHQNLARLRGEMADIGSWLFALACRLEINLSQKVWEQYPYECEKCRKPECTCKSSDPSRNSGT